MHKSSTSTAPFVSNVMRSRIYQNMYFVPKYRTKRHHDIEHSDPAEVPIIIGSPRRENCYSATLFRFPGFLNVPYSEPEPEETNKIKKNASSLT
ncbi:hypothetical protein V6N13_079116 [Hibiscus sabdariffa]